MIRVLLIEGDPEGARHFIEAAGGENACRMSVASAGTLAEGLRLLGAAGADIVFSALDLPDSSGVQTLLRLHAHSAGLPVIVLGTGQQEELGRRVVEQGAQDFLERGSFGPAALRRMVTSAITRQLRLNALRGREDLVRNLTMMNADGILIIDESAVVRFANPAAEGLLPAPLVGAPFGHALDPARATEIELAPKPSSAGDTPGLSAGDGRPRVVEARSAAIRWKGRPALLASLRDVTDRKRVETALREAHDAAQEASRAKSDFVANMSHEIRTPLNTILGMTELLAETGLGPDQQECVSVLERSGELLLHLVNNVLDLSKIEAGALELERAEFDLLAEVEKVASTLDHAARRKGLQLARRFEAGLAPRRLGDPSRLGQVLVNLAANAVKFTEAGEVAIAVAADPAGPGGRVRFAVSDTGPGIAPEKRALIFESFRQAESSVSRRYGGTGLGLAISRKLVEAMGGTLRLESEVGRGSTFSFSIPLEAAATRGGAVESGPVAPQAPAAATPRAATGEAIGPAARALRILLVDDAPDNRLLVRRYLRGTDHSLEEAEDGRAAVEKFSSGAYDLVLMDVQMPVLDGLSAMREIRRLERERGAAAPTPIVALTASVDKEELARCVDAGCSAYLGKPVRKADLLGALSASTAAAAVDPTPDPEIADLLPGYLENRRRDLAALSGALARGDFAALKAAGHAILGSAASYGCEPLGRASRELEEAALAKDEAAAAAALARMADYLARVRLP